MTGNKDNSTENSTDNKVDSFECTACEATYSSEGTTDVSIGNEHFEVCQNCAESLQSRIVDYPWYNRLTREQYDKASEYLRQLEEVWCVHANNGYHGGEMWIHTPYCDASVVRDVVDIFGFKIRWFSVVYPEDDGFDCVQEHGPCIEINIEYSSNSPLPLPPEALEGRNYSEVEWMKKNKKLFNRESEENGK